MDLFCIPEYDLSSSPLIELFFLIIVHIPRLRDSTLSVFTLFFFFKFCSVCASDKRPQLRWGFVYTCKLTGFKGKSDE